MEILAGSEYTDERARIPAASAGLGKPLKTSLTVIDAGCCKPIGLPT